ncbi:MAG: hypothetical protein AAFX93_02680 [Verrucomicrobiota bacterium]
MQQPQTVSPKLPVWVIWYGLFSSLFVYRFFLLDKTSDPEVVNTGGTISIAVLVFLILPVLISTAIRWTFVPKAKTFQQLLPLLITGCAIGESLAFFGIFLFPQHLDVFFYASVAMVGQFIPTYLSNISMSPPLVKTN